MLELILSIAAILVIVSLARLGALFGVFYELTSALLLYLAMMITLRYWYEAAHWVESVLPGAGAYGAFGTFWAMFLVGCLPLILVLNRVTAESVPRYPKYVDMALGVVFGFVAGVILICCVFTSLSVITPKIWEPYNHEALTFPFDNNGWASARLTLATRVSPRSKKRTPIIFKSTGGRNIRFAEPGDRTSRLSVFGETRYQKHNTKQYNHHCRPKSLDPRNQSDKNRWVVCRADRGRRLRRRFLKRN